MDTRLIYVFALVCSVFFVTSSGVMQCLSMLIIPVLVVLPLRKCLYVLISFYSVICLPLIHVLYAFTNNSMLSFLGFVVVISLNVIVLMAALSRGMLPRSVKLPVAIVILSVPPLANFNPIAILPLSGWLFPGFGTIGILLFLFLIAATVLCVEAPKKTRRYAAYPVMFISTATIGVAHATLIEQNSYRSFDITVSGIDVLRPFDINLLPETMRVAYRHEELDMALNDNADVLVFPESIYGYWNESDGTIMKNAHSDIFGGARIVIGEDAYINTVINAKTGRVVYEQRRPPALASNLSVRAAPGRGTVVNTGMRFLICYELTNSWISYQSFSTADDPVVWIANLSWLEHGQYLVDRLRSVNRAWGQLFNKRPHSAVMLHD